MNIVEAAQPESAKRTSQGGQEIGDCVLKASMSSGGNVDARARELISGYGRSIKNQSRALVSVLPCRCSFSGIHQWIAENANFEGPEEGDVMWVSPRALLNVGSSIIVQESESSLSANHVKGHSFW